MMNVKCDKKYYIAMLSGIGYQVTLFCHIPR